MNSDRPVMPKGQIVYGECVYYLTVVACLICIVGPLIAMIDPENNVMNPYFTFAAIFQGHSAQEVWTIVAGGFPGGHFWMDNFFTGDGFTQFGLALGCSSAGFALIVAAVVYAFEKIYLYAGFCLFVSAFVFLAASGLVKL
jgi:hypothetical protein